MTLLLREIGRFLAGAGLWILALAAVTGLVAAAVLYLSERELDRRSIGWAIVAGAGLAALAHRISGAVVWAPRIGGRDLPVVWAAVGAAGTAIWLVLARRHTEP